jgi:EAL domain-containing protein (putative c-di-GMP-specific phosphodiesterase class I)
MAEGHITGFEALIHWQHPQHGLLSAGQFLPLAHETGQILPIDWWVLEEACSQVQSWQTRYHFDPPLKASVNFGSSILMHADFIQSMKGVLEKTGLQPENLILEIPESIVALNIEAVALLVADLREAGISVQIDDFGKGYSTLLYLNTLAINALKIDQAFVQLIQDNGQDSQIPKMIITLAHELGIKTIAEGIENEIQLQHLRQMSCDYGQGFLFSNPLEKTVAQQLLENTYGKSRHRLPWLRYWKKKNTEALGDRSD